MFGLKKRLRRDVTQSRQRTQSPYENSFLRPGPSLQDPSNGKIYYTTYYTRDVNPMQSADVMHRRGLQTPAFRAGDRGPNFEDRKAITSGVIGDHTSYVNAGAVAGEGVCILDGTVLQAGANVQGFTCIKSSDISGYVCESYLENSHVEGSVVSTYGDGLTVFKHAQCSGCTATKDVQLWDNSQAKGSELHQAKLTGTTCIEDCEASQSLLRDVKASRSTFSKSGLCGGNIDNSTIRTTTMNLYGRMVRRKTYVDGEEQSPIKGYDAQAFSGQYEDLRNEPDFQEGY